MAAAAPLPKLQIIKATYAKTSGNDVTQKLRDLVAKNGGNLIMDAKTDFNQVFGDPEPRADKLLHVVYSYGPNGAQKSMTHAEKHVDIYLPALEIKQGQVLTVNVIKAVGLRDTRTIGKQNPYAKLTTGSESFKTKHHEKGGTDPTWNQSFIFNLDGKDQFMHVVVYDKETISDDTIARFDIPLATLAAAQGEVAYNLVHPNDFKKSAGAIVLSCEFRDPNAPVIPAAAAAPAPAPVQQQPQVIYQQPQPQVVYMQPQQPQVIYQQPQVVYQQPQPVYQQPQVVYQQPVVQQPAPQVVYQAPVVQQPQYKQPEPAVVYSPPAAAAGGATVWPGVAIGANDASEFNKCPHSRFKYDGAYITCHDGRVFDVQGGSQGVGTAVIAYGKKSGSDVLNQQWDFKNGMFITRMGTGLAITIGGDYIKSGAPLVMGEATGAGNQTWDIDEFGFVHNKINREQCWSMDNGSGKLLVWQQHPGIKYPAVGVMVWPGVPVGANDESELRKCPHSRFRYDGSYIICHDGRVFDVQNGSREEGANVISYGRKSGSDAANQQWDFKDGVFITRMGTGLAITVSGDVRSGSGLVMGALTGAANQVWELDKFGFVHCKQDRSQCWSMGDGGKLLVWEQHPGIKY